ncbi:MAG TPA: Holliday junction branch migration protein RuvA [Vitreimonas sp.]|uniref:Holliday junction branch migration protein RuvA n=1 Tax=Vitreimonas sp. TaxID=3069702 RepID=UPI002D61616A|nr:Holliday junction branch migration protein RuvA [Vitreimonas sp.]HYD87655.1 Holliday junction branch migration protein RuvA [Vitreimonas sp.]
MIGSLNGTVAAVGEETALIEVGGVGYVVQSGARTLSRLAVGAPVKLFIETHVREDAIRLFGFSGEEERAWFAHLQTIPGVGAKVALGILDAMPPEVLVDAIALQDKAAFARANGVGPKLAARLATELAAKQGPKGFIGMSAGAARSNGAPPPVNGARAEAVSALVNLGIDQSSAARAVASAAKQFAADAPAPELIRAALKEVSR